MGDRLRANILPRNVTSQPRFVRRNCVEILIESVDLKESDCSNLRYVTTFDKFGCRQEGTPAPAKTHWIGLDSIGQVSLA